ncbi:group II intron maturase-specific domain-containing protein [Mycobacterium attenuatum]|uniref:group II intron maturase-specific domain-containing protein n=1 Tax=Mycobacterium attenuatum TaxID=2341086 RepID=UPI001B7D6FEA
MHRCVTVTFADLARRINPVVRGWMNYCRAYYPTAFISFPKRINTYLARWIRRNTTIQWHPARATSMETRRRMLPGSLHSLAMTTHALSIKMARAGDGRLSRPVLREPGGAIPPGHPTPPRLVWFNGPTPHQHVPPRGKTPTRRRRGR